MIVSAQWLETYIICQVLLATAVILVRLTPGGRSRHRRLWLARMVFLSAVVTPVLVRFVDPPRRALLPAVVSLDEMSRLALAKVINPPRDSSLPAEVPTRSAWRQIDPLSLCWTIVLLGALLHLSRASRDLVRIRRILRVAVPLRSVGHVRVVVSAHCRVPFSVALFTKAYVVVPTHMLANASHVRMAISHEIQHHRQGDCWTAYVLEASRAVFFWNPGIHLWHSTLAELQEFSCDEVLIGRRTFEPHAYGRCLLSVAQAASQPIGPSRQNLACVVGMARDGGTPASLLRRRILMLPQYRSAAPQRTIVGVLAGFFMITTSLGLAYAAQGSLTPLEAPSLDLSQIDPRLQRIADARVKEALTQFKARSAAIVVARPQTGTVVAFAEAHSQQPATQTWATRTFAPGSTTKPFVVAAALESGAVTEDQMHDCEQPYDVGGTQFHNHTAVLKKVSTTEAIAQSVNVCVIKMAQATGKERVRHTLQQFGFRWTDGTSSDKPEMSAEDASAVLGVTLPTDLSTMIRAYSILANRGRSLASPSEQVISEKTADAIGRMLVAAVNEGTGTRAKLPHVTVAGKTGTVMSRMDPKAADGDGPFMAMFGGFAPAEGPRLVAFVIIENGLQGQEQAGGGIAAAPTFREVMGESLAALDQPGR